VRFALMALLLAASPAALAQQPLQQPLPPGGWVGDSRGCKVWSAAPEANEPVSWSGACIAGYAYGRGVLQWSDGGRPGERYDGEMKQGKRDGRGVQTWANGDRYEGEFRDGKQNGRGVFSFGSGERYAGQFKDGAFSGQGTMTFADGGSYEGEWRGDKPNGVGTKREPGGSVFKGTWKNGCFRQGDKKAWVGVTEKDCGF
jgi:hypothetical protein